MARDQVDADGTIVLDIGDLPEAQTKVRKVRHEWTKEPLKDALPERERNRNPSAEI